MQENTKSTARPGNAGASGLQKNAGLKPWEIAVKLLPSGENAVVDVEHASDAEFQAWIDVSGLSEMIDDDGIAAWSFDDRCRIINHVLRSGRVLQFVENNSNNSENNSESELLDSGESAS